MSYDAKYLRGLSNEELEGTISERDERITALEEANAGIAEQLTAAQALAETLAAERDEAKRNVKRLEKRSEIHRSIIDGLNDQKLAGWGEKEREEMQRLREQVVDVPDGSDPLHPNGRCRCYGEGRCTWCLLSAAQHRLATLEKLAGELIAALPRCNGYRSVAEGDCQRVATHLHHDDYDNMVYLYCAEHAAEIGSDAQPSALDSPLREMRAFLASDSAAGEKGSARQVVVTLKQVARPKPRFIDDDEPQQGAAESAALFSPEMVEALWSVSFGRNGAYAEIDPMFGKWATYVGNTPDGDGFTREAAIRRAFDLSRGEKGST